MEQRAPSPRRLYSVEEYFRMEAATDERLEYYDGVIVAMSGGSVNHIRVVHNVSGEFRVRLAGRPCEAFDPGLRVRLNRRRRYVHPDVTRGLWSRRGRPGRRQRPDPW
jgi:Uma2 family endonuclease